VSNLSTLREHLRSEDLVDVFVQWHWVHHYLHAKHRVGFAYVSNALIAVDDLFHLGVGRSPFVGVCLDGRDHEKRNKGRVEILGRCLQEWTKEACCTMRTLLHHVCLRCAQNIH
jgi:hypothetical protein